MSFADFIFGNKYPTKKEPTMADGLRKLGIHELEESISDAAVERVRQIRRELPPVHNIPEKNSVEWRRSALGTIADMCVNLRYGEMMDFAAGLVLSLETSGKDGIDVDAVAKSVHHWAKNFKEEDDHVNT